MIFADGDGRRAGKAGRGKAWRDSWRGGDCAGNGGVSLSDKQERQGKGEQDGKGEETAQLGTGGFVEQDNGQDDIEGDGGDGEAEGGGVVHLAGLASGCCL